MQDMQDDVSTQKLVSCSWHWELLICSSSYQLAVTFLICATSTGLNVG